MKKNVLIGLVVAWIIGLLCGFFLSVIIRAKWRSDGPALLFENQIQGNLDATSVYAQDSVLIYEVAAKMTKTTFGNKAHVEYKIRNIGHKTLNTVKVKIYLLDNRGNAIYENEHHAVWINEVLGDGTGPLKPNYIKSVSTFVPSALAIEECPSEWAVGNVKLEISAIEFNR